MPSSGYTAISFTAGEQPTTAKWNLVGSNDASFNTGNGFNDAILIDRHFSDGSVNPRALVSGAGTSWVWQDYSSSTTVVGWSSFTNKIVKWCQIGKTVFVIYYLDGVSNSTNATFTVPIACKPEGSNSLAVEATTGLVIDNGAVVSQGQRVYIDANSDPTLAIVQYAFTASGSKKVRGQFFYEVA